MAANVTARAEAAWATVNTSFLTCAAKA